jgi:hypothetical protein
MTTMAFPANAVMAQMICGGVWVNQALYVAARLGVADLLADGPKPIGDLAGMTSASVDGLRRVLRTLASIGVFAETEDGRIALTPLAETLRTGTPDSVRAMAILWGHPMHWKAWGSFLDTVRTGVDSFQLTFQQPLFEFFAANPDLAELFDQSMTSFSAFEADAIAAAFDFSRFETIVDVGGGEGLLLSTTLQRNPTARGAVVDLPHLAPRAAAVFDRIGVSDRATFVPGDFFQPLPARADAVVLKNIVHDFDDQLAAAILRRCREALTPNGRVLIVQEVIPIGNAPSAGKMLDMQMLLIGGRERTEDEYRALAGKAGLQIVSIAATAASLHVIEAVAKP